MSGVVEAVATDVQGFSVGDEVFGMVRFPSFGESAAYAEYVAAPASDLAIKPAGIDHVHAAGSAMAGLTAWQFPIELGHKEQNPLQPEMHRPVPLNGKTVLVNGAAGGVGHLAVQLAKWKGAHVIAVASGKHESFLRELGADEFLDYTRSAPEEVAHDVDLVLDTLGGPTTARFLRTLRRGGALFPVFFGFSEAEEAAKLGVTVSMTQVRSNGSQLAELGRLLNSGTVRVVIRDNMERLDFKRCFCGFGHGLQATVVGGIQNYVMRNDQSVLGIDCALEVVCRQCAAAHEHEPCPGSGFCLSFSSAACTADGSMLACDSSSTFSMLSR